MGGGEISEKKRKSSEAADEKTLLVLRFTWKKGRKGVLSNCAVLCSEAKTAKD